MQYLKNYLGQLILNCKNSHRRNSVTYRMPCHARGHGFFTIAMLLRGRHAVPVVPVHLVIQPASQASQPASIKASLGASSSTLMLAGLHADLRNKIPGPSDCLIHSNPQTLCFEQFIYKAYDIIKTLLVMNILTLQFLYCFIVRKRHTTNIKPLCMLRGAY